MRRIPVRPRSPLVKVRTPPVMRMGQKSDGMLRLVAFILFEAKIEEMGAQPIRLYGRLYPAIKASQQLTLAFRGGASTALSDACKKLFHKHRCLKHQQGPGGPRYLVQYGMLQLFLESNPLDLPQLIIEEITKACEKITRKTMD